MNETEKFYELDDIFFQEEARRLCASFNNDPENEDHLHYLHRKLQYMKTLQNRLTLPWHDYIPILYSSFALYIHSIDNKKKLNRVLQLSTELIECIVFLSENGGLLMRTADYYDKQIKELEEKMEK